MKIPSGQVLLKKKKINIFKCGKLCRIERINRSGSLVDQLQIVKDIWVGQDVKK